MNEDRTYEAWLDETNRVVSFHAIPAARHFRAAGEEFWSLIRTIAEKGEIVTTLYDTFASEAILGIIKKFCRKFVI